jgi:hypothetical protein
VLLGFRGVVFGGSPAKVYFQHEKQLKKQLIQKMLKVGLLVTW